MKKYQQGFTLIELMIVIAILGILIAIALPAYQDYTVRAKVSECANMMASAKTAVAEYRASHTALPTNAAAAGVDTQATKYCDQLTIANGVISVQAPSTKTGGTGNVTIIDSPTVNATSGDIDWKCKATGTTKYAPGTCR
ncbi:pilin [Luteimonas sp. 50]|uniref:Pilin n=1 Tax=Cognatiluteimonas sedimenti TaxID=2927791 RepID=A0ABT0A430_9GAMM|nr:pilin [Lysobacter sedimenti]MCJ0825715.1 pilin [Lysobacter sedimenti]